MDSIKRHLPILVQDLINRMSMGKSRNNERSRQLSADLRRDLAREYASALLRRAAGDREQFSAKYEEVLRHEWEQCLIYHEVKVEEPGIREDTDNAYRRILAMLPVQVAALMGEQTNQPRNTAVQEPMSRVREEMVETVRRND